MLRKIRDKGQGRQHLYVAGEIGYPQPSCLKNVHGEEYMRLVTRADFDGLVCAVLLAENGKVDSFLFTHPQQIKEGLVDVGADDILANLPYLKTAGGWFDHHYSEMERLESGEISLDGKEGDIKILPSAAHVIWDYYGGGECFPKNLAGLLEAADKVDSAALSEEDVRNPQGWVLLGLLLDPRTGLTLPLPEEGALYRQLIELCRTQEVESILQLPEIERRIRRYHEDTRQYEAMLRRFARLCDNVLVIDLRHVDHIPVGNRFLPYLLFPECNVSVQLRRTGDAGRYSLSVGRSIFNSSCTANIGMIMAELGGGGHAQVGGCTLAAADAEKVLEHVVAGLKTCI